MRSMSRRQVLVAVVGALFALNIVGLIVSIAARWPTELDGAGDPDDVLGEFVARGTLLTSPLTTLILFAVFVLVLFTGGRLIGAAAAAGMIVTGILFTIGHLGEPLEPEMSDPPKAFLIAWRAVAVILSGSMAVLAAYELRDRLLPERPPPRRR
jgi:hypothetical protein